jgi:hypothetical protein
MFSKIGPNVSPVRVVGKVECLPGLKNSDAGPYGQKQIPFDYAQGRLSPAEAGSE